MPNIIFDDGYMTIWSFKQDTILQYHFNRCGFSKTFQCDIPEIKAATKLENKSVGIMYKF